MFVVGRPDGHLLFALIVAGCLGCFPLRAAQQKAATGVIVSRSCQPAGVYRQYPGGKRKGLSAPSEIPIADSITFEIRVERLGTIRYPLNSVSAREFAVGQKVQIVYVKRAIVPLRTRIYVREMRHVE